MGWQCNGTLATGCQAVRPMHAAGGWRSSRLAGASLPDVGVLSGKPVDARTGPVAGRPGPVPWRSATAPRRPRAPERPVGPAGAW